MNMEVAVETDASAWLHGAVNWVQAAVQAMAERRQQNGIDPTAVMEPHETGAILHTQAPVLPVAQVWVMTKPGRDLAPMLLAQRPGQPVVVHLAGPPDPARFQRQPYQTLLTTYFGITPQPGVNYSKALTELGYALASQGPLPELSYEGPTQTAYPWRSWRPTPYRTITAQTVAENPASWWTRPTFEAQEVSSASAQGGSALPIWLEWEQLLGG